MKGKLYELRAEVVAYYWSSTGEPPGLGVADSVIASMAADDYDLDADVDIYDSPALPFDYDRKSLIYSDDHDADITIGYALDAMKEAREKAAFDARQERLL